MRVFGLVLVLVFSAGIADADEKLGEEMLERHCQAVVEFWDFGRSVRTNGDPMLKTWREIKKTVYKGTEPSQIDQYLEAYADGYQHWKNPTRRVEIEALCVTGLRFGIE
jgi:hypothetical protein